MTHLIPRAFGAILLAGVLATSACVTPGGLTASSTPLQNRTFEIVGPAEGKSNYSWALFGLFTFGKPDIAVAIKQAVEQKGGDALINVSWYERTYYFFFFSLHRVYVSGEAIKFSAPPPPEEKTPPQEKKAGKGRR